MNKPLPTKERVCELLDYEPKTGVFTWKVARRHVVKAGDIAGSVNGKGYLIVGIDGRQIRASRLAWLVMTGHWPENEIDHANGVRLDNRFDNLSDVTTKQNQWNRQKAKHGCRSQLLGAYATKNGKWGSAITRDGKARWLGTFETSQEAHDAYAEARSDCGRAPIGASGV